MKAWDEDVARQERILQRHFRAWDTTPPTATARPAKEFGALSPSYSEKWLGSSEPSSDAPKSTEDMPDGAARRERKGSFNEDAASGTIADLRLDLRAANNQNEDLLKRVEALEASNKQLQAQTEESQKASKMLSPEDRLAGFGSISVSSNYESAPATPATPSSLGSSLSSPRSPHVVNPAMHIVGTDGRARKSSMVAKQGRRMSIGTSVVLNDMSCTTCLAPVANRVMQAFRDPSKVSSYVNSPTFAQDIISLCKKVSPIFEAEARCLRLQHPVYVFGDVHGNVVDLRFFQENVWRLGMELTGGKFLFLGDYVDRGMLGLEVAAYLFSQKCELPNKIFMLRGNHETRSVNGDEGWYGAKSFGQQCRVRFGEALGQEVYEEVNKVFDRLPLSAVIDGDIFCVHGGIPRPVPGMTEIQAIECVPAVFDPDASEDASFVQTVTDCVWSDPATKFQEQELDETGFGESLRGEDAVCFGTPAINRFLERNELSYIMRAHTSLTEGIDLSKGARVFTIFSTSKDHGGGPEATCGCVLVDEGQIKVINRSPSYERYKLQKRATEAAAEAAGPPDEVENTNIVM